MCYEFGDAPTIGSNRAAQWKQIIGSTKATWRREEEDILKVDRQPTHNITWLSIKQIVCTSTWEWEGENFIKSLEEYNKNFLHLTLRRLQAFHGCQEQRTLVTKLLSRISHLDEIRP